MRRLEQANALQQESFTSEVLGQCMSGEGKK